MKYGFWINHNGVYYSNHSFNGYKAIYTNYNYIYQGDLFDDQNYNYSYRNSHFYSKLFKKHKKKDKRELQYCDYCCSYQPNCVLVDDGYVYNLEYCTCCKSWKDQTEMHDRYTCESCFNEFQNDGETFICMYCGRDCLLEDESNIDNICKNCYHDCYEPTVKK